MNLPRISLAIAAVASTGLTVAAEPGDPADPTEPAEASPRCSVDLVRVPSDVRAIVERWVHAEPRCNVHLEVRIVPTEGGFYVLARDDRGRSHERVVPDATSAGVLIASWASDDAIAPPPRRRGSRPLRIAAIGSPRSIDPDAPLPLRASLVVDRGDHEDLGPRYYAKTIPARPRSIILSGFTSLASFSTQDRSAMYGLQGTFEYWPSNNLMFGAGGLIATGAKDGTGAMGVTDTAALLHVALTTGRGDIEVIPSIGAGLMYTTSSEFAEIGVVGQVQLQLSLALSPRYSLVVGPSLTLYSAPESAQWLDRSLDIMLSGGIRWGS